MKGWVPLSPLILNCEHIVLVKTQCLHWGTEFKRYTVALLPKKLTPCYIKQTKKKNLSKTAPREDRFNTDYEMPSFIKTPLNTFGHLLGRS